MMNKYYPETLKTLPIWALWRIEADPKGRPTKVPYSAHSNRRASSIDPATWGTFSQVMNRFRTRPGFYNGISLMITKDYELVFIDIDHCIDDDGVMNETAADIIGAFSGQYIEYSQSGSGVHIITKGKIPRSFKNSRNGVEMYNDKRFCALTGDVLEEADPYVNQPAIDFVFKKYKTPEHIVKRVISQNTALQKDDKWVIERASSRNNKFSLLYSGNWQAAGYSSQSEADLSLCIILAFWTDGNTEQIDRLFRSSGLYRQKWDRDDYREATIQKALDCTIETYSSWTRRKNVERGDRFDRALSERWDR